MGLFQRVSKTSIWARKGNISIKKFLDFEQKPAISIVLHEDGKKHSITLYKGELEQLEWVLKEGKFEQP